MAEFNLMNALKNPALWYGLAAMLDSRNADKYIHMTAGAMQGRRENEKLQAKEAQAKLAGQFENLLLQNPNMPMTQVLAKLGELDPENTLGRMGPEIIQNWRTSRRGQVADTVSNLLQFGGQVDPEQLASISRWNPGAASGIEKYREQTPEHPGMATTPGGGLLPRPKPTRITVPSAQDRQLEATIAAQERLKKMGLGAYRPTPEQEYMDKNGLDYLAMLTKKGEVENQVQTALHKAMKQGGLGQYNKTTLDDAIAKALAIEKAKGGPGGELATLADSYKLKKVLGKDVTVEEARAAAATLEDDDPMLEQAQKDVKSFSPEEPEGTGLMGWLGRLFGGGAGAGPGPQAQGTAETNGGGLLGQAPGGPAALGGRSALQGLSQGPAVEPKPPKETAKEKKTAEVAQFLADQKDGDYDLGPDGTWRKVNGKLFRIR